MTSYGTMIDCTGSSLPGLLSALGSNYPDVIATYVTGTDGVEATHAQIGDLRADTGVFLYDQTPQLEAFSNGLTDAADVETGAGILEDAIKACKARQGRGWWSWVYLNASNLEAGREQAKAAGLTKTQWGVANWNLTQQEAKDFLDANKDVAYVQWASPSSNPNTICPGTSKTLNELNCDLNVTLGGWFVKASNVVPPVKNQSGLLVMADLSTRKLSSTDGTHWA
jgi:hypothetical protein